MESRFSQRDAALELAQSVRAARSELREWIGVDASWRLLVDVIAGDVDELEETWQAARLDGVYIADLVTAAPGIGRGKARTLIRNTLGVDIETAYRLKRGDLPARHRGALAVALELARRRLSDDYITRIATERTAA